MIINGRVHLLFEQSATFKREFIKLGIPAEDYDIQNNFGETDHVIDLFAEINKAYDDEPSIFDDILKDDLTMAFFPCIYFSQQNTTFFNGTNLNWKNNTTREKADFILKRSRERQYYYELALKLFTIFDVRGLRLIVENPWTSPHYLYLNFPYKPAIIDKNRQLRGDIFRKPTQYWYVNCEPTYGQSFQKPVVTRTVNSLTGHQGSLCDEDRSLISPDYARNFICDFIIGKSQQHSEPTLF
ncbi:hypothetical protein [Prevotella sp. E2-28]|uniref:hypothetical protein n=1 Tax=Prevotella sp. E2-28 TaxID=2913620 RepID=UPI001EDAC56C|nr:hypothetical protein [Prevotella sp. E2-28]UKK52702.1 hypothetical protein L6465_08800 [Prevotella sp. E2-28]